MRYFEEAICHDLPPMNCNYPDPKPVEILSRDREKSITEAEALADSDFELPLRQFLKEIYKEAYNSQQQPDGRLAKVLMKCAAMTARVAHENDQSAKLMLSLAKWTLAVAILALAVSISQIFHHL